jgi:uncharacterized membrane protein YjfL (UPF0719 family)
MLIEFLTSKFFFVIPMLFGSLLFLFMLRFMSLGTGTTHKEARQEIMNGNVAMAIYFGLRVVGVATAVAGTIIAGTSV